MKRLILTLVMVLALAGLGFSTNYYVHSAADAGGDGTTQELTGEHCAFKTIAQVNAGTYVAGDTISFNRGESWNDTYLNPPASGSPGLPITFTAYGTGALPIITATATSAVWVGSKNYITLSYLNIVTTNQRCIQFYANTTSETGMVVDHCVLTPSTMSAKNAVDIVLTNPNTFTNFTFTNNEVSLDGQGNGIYINVGANQCHTWTITGNYFHNIEIGNAIQINGDAATTGVSNTPLYGLNVSYNTFADIDACAVSISGGLKATAVNLISHNSLLRIGNAAVANINALQLSWCKNLIVEYNSIDTVATSVPDGMGIEVDFCWVNTAYDCDGVIVRYNKVTGCNEANSAGIQVYHALNTQVYGNICYGNSTGLEIVNSDSTGTVFYNNTCYNNRFGAYINTNAPASVWRNNILSANVNKGFAKHVTATAPTEDHNCVYGGTNDIALHVTDITSDPKFVSPNTQNFHLLPTSPCINAGINVGLIWDFDGNHVPGMTDKLVDIGALEYYPAK